MKMKFSPKTEALAEEMIKKVKKAPELKRIQSVLLGCKGLTAEHISVITGFKANYVRQIWMKCRKEGLTSLVGEKRGQARGKAHMSLEEEASFLEEFHQRANAGELVTIEQLRSAHSKRVGKRVNPTVTYRLLKRHKWRKISPRPEHPKYDADEIERFKKAFFPPGFDPYEN